MGKVFIDVFDCKTPHKIFTGKNALLHATFFIDKGFVCNDADRLYQYKPLFKLAMSWHKANDFREGDCCINGEGVHSKIYEYKGHLILSSQNQVSSPLFEFAIVYSEKPKLYGFILKTFKRAKLFSEWWVDNNYYGLKGKRNER